MREKAVPMPTEAEMLLVQIEGSRLARKDLVATLARWREMYELEEDGRRFVSVPIAVFDALLRK
jgi:hypothetical protein